MDWEAAKLAEIEKIEKQMTTKIAAQEEAQAKINEPHTDRMRTVYLSMRRALLLLPCLGLLCFAQGFRGVRRLESEGDDLVRAVGEAADPKEEPAKELSVAEENANAKVPRSIKPSFL